MTFTKTINLIDIVCGTCGIPYAVPDGWIAERQKEAGSIHCPNGCRRVWQESEADKLRRQLAATQVELRAEHCSVLHKQHLLDEERAEKIKLERKLKRVGRGVCPCCNRSFINLARHMNSKHPEKKDQNP